MDGATLHLSDNSDEELIREYGVKKRMKIVGIMVLCLLVGCAARPPIDELEAEALKTGDWAAVEKREHIDKNWGVVNTDSVCHGEKVEICYKKSAQKECACVSPHDLRPR